MTQQEFLKEIVEFFNEDGSYWLTCKCLGARLNKTDDEIDELFTKFLEET